MRGISLLVDERLDSLRHHTNHGRAHHLLDLIDGLNGCIKVLKEVGKPYPGHESEHHTERNIHNWLRTDGSLLVRFLCFLYKLNSRPGNTQLDTFSEEFGFQLIPDRPRVLECFSSPAKLKVGS